MHYVHKRPRSIIGQTFCAENYDHTYVPLFKILEKLTGKERRQNKFKPFCVLSIKQYILHSQ